MLCCETEVFKGSEQSLKIAPYFATAQLCKSSHIGPLQEVPLIHVFLHMLCTQDGPLSQHCVLLQMQPKEKPNIYMITVCLFTYFVPGKLLNTKYSSSPVTCL